LGRAFGVGGLPEAIVGNQGVARRLDGLLGRAVYRATIPADDFPALSARLERAVRAGYEPEGFAVRVEVPFGSWFLHAHRGLLAGFGVGLIPDSGPDREPAVLVGVGRSSRLDEAAGWVAGGLAVVAAALSMLALGAAGWPLPAPVLAVVAIVVLVVVLLVTYQLLIPAVAGVEFLGGGRLTEDRLAAVVALVRGIVEAPPEASPRHQPVEPGVAPAPEHRESGSGGR
jgi:hypothetical protein